jgi:hypothetical protein
MKKLALLALALELAVCGCASNIPSTITTTKASGNWEAQLTGGIDQASRLDFVTSFNVTPNTAGTAEPLDITGFGFINNGACFATDQNGITTETEAGLATINTNNGTDQVTGTLTMEITSVTPPGNTLTLTGNLTGTSNGTTFTNGTLSNGVVQGTWTLTGGAGDPTCAGSGNFLMCQAAATCTPP